MAGIPTLVIYILSVSLSCIHGESTDETKTVKPEDRIFGGQNAMPNEFPHQIQIFHKKADGSGTLCGASLLSMEWILTAAHCGTPKPKPGEITEIIAGRHSGAGVADDPGQQTSTVKETFIHPCYDRTKIDKFLTNDIALMKLTTPFTLNDKVSIIQFDETDRAKPGIETTALGWGRIGPDKTVLAPVLKKATLNLPAAGRCNSTRTNVSRPIVGPGLNVESQQCVEKMDSTVCEGDSGGPLLCKDGGVNYVCGIVSLLQDPSCTGNGWSIFTRVFYFRNWIKEVMGSGCNSDVPCVRQLRGGYDEVKTPLPPCEKMNNNSNGGMNNNSTGGMGNNNSTNSTAALTVHGQSQHGFYIPMFLTLLLFTY